MPPRIPQRARKNGSVAALAITKFLTLPSVSSQVYANRLYIICMARMVNQMGHMPGKWVSCNIRGASVHALGVFISI